MLNVNDIIMVGSIHAAKHNYSPITGKKAVIIEREANSKFSTGIPSLIVRPLREEGITSNLWYVAIEDCLPVNPSNNQSAKLLLDKEY